MMNNMVGIMSPNNDPVFFPKHRFTIIITIFIISLANKAEAPLGQIVRHLNSSTSATDMLN